MEDEDFMTDLVEDQEDPQDDYLEGANKEVEEQDPDPDKVVNADLEMDPAAATESYVRRRFGLSESDIEESCETLQDMDFSQEGRVVGPLVDTVKDVYVNMFKNLKSLFSSENKLTRRSWFDGAYLYSGNNTTISDKNDLMKLPEFKEQLGKLKKFTDKQKEKPADLTFVKKMLGSKANNDNCFTFNGSTIVLFVPSAIDGNNVSNRTIIYANVIFNKKENPATIKDLNARTFFAFATRIPNKNVEWSPSL